MRKTLIASIFILIPAIAQGQNLKENVKAAGLLAGIYHTCSQYYNIDREMIFESIAIIDKNGKQQSEYYSEFVDF